MVSKDHSDNLNTDARSSRQKDSFREQLEENLRSYRKGKRKRSRRSIPRVRELEKHEQEEIDLMNELLEREFNQRGREFLEAAERGNAPIIEEIIESGFRINYQDPRTRETALHVVAGSRARKALRVLLGTGECDHLLRDAKGRLASEVAYLDGRDPAVARLLGVKERKQARAQGFTIRRRP